MKRFLFIGLMLLSLGLNAQILNQTADWGAATTWSLTGTYDAAFIIGDPTVGATFGFDDDAAGNGSNNTIECESAAIDLTAVVAGGETWITASGDYAHTLCCSQVLSVEYYDADAATWTVWESLLTNSASSEYQSCNNVSSYVTPVLDIAGFTATQQSGFQYRISYFDNNSWAWGFCSGPPTIVSEAPPACLDPTALTASNITNSTADLGWTENGTATLWNLEIGISGFAPTGTPTDAGVTTNPFAYSGGAELTTYDFYVQADCGAVDGLSTWVGPFSFTTLANCPVPSALTATNITDVGADLSWTENGTATVYDLEIGLDGFVPSGTPTNVSVANGYQYSSGVAETAYDYYVRADCASGGGTGISAWVGPFSFTTECTPIIPDYAEDFTTMTSTVVPDCWFEAASGDPTTGPMGIGAGNWTSDGFGNVGTTGAAKINLYTTSFDEWMITPSFDLSTGGPFQADFNIALTQFGSTNSATLGSDDQVIFLITTDGGATWTALETWDATTPVSNTGDAITVDLTAYTGTVQFAFYGADGIVDDAEDNDFFVDDFNVRTPPSCVDPSGLTASNTTNMSTDLTWTENDNAVTWDLYYGISPLAAPDGTTVPTEDNVGSNTNYSITGLTAGETYEFYVRSECGQAGQSAWVGPISENIPGPGESCADAIGIAVEADCATATANTADFNDAVLVDYTSCDAFGDNYGFWYSFTPTTASVIFTTSSTVGVEVAVFDACAGTELYCSNTASTADREINGLTAGVVHYMVIWKDGASTDVVDFCLETGPNCFDPSGLALDAVTGTTADISWTIGSTASTGFSLEYGPAAFTPGSGTIINTGTIGGPISIAGLMSGTLYDVYVTEVCDGANTGTAGPFQFATECIPFASDYCADFSTYIPLCWDEATEGDLTTGPTGTLGLGNWVGSSAFGNNGTNTATKINLYSNFISDWLILPEFDLGMAGHGLFMDFDLALTEYNNGNPSTLGSDDQVHVAITTDGGATWASIQLWDASTAISGLGQLVTIDLAAYSGTVQFAFYASSGAISDPEDNDVHVDNVCVRVPPSCIDPTNLTVTNVTTSGADVGLTENAMATMWDLEFVPAGATPTGVPTIEDVTTNPYTWTGGMQLTDYDVYMRSDCGQSQSIWLGPQTFTTLASCPAPTALAASATNNTASLSWTAGGTETMWDVELGAAGFTPTGTPTTAGVMNPYVEMGLTGETDYEYYVRADCGAVDGLSEWTGPFAFTTLCDGLMPDVCEDFTGMDFSNTPQCWLEAGSGDLTTGPMNTGVGSAGEWTGDTFGNAGSQSARINLFDLGTSDWLISSPYDLSGGGYQLDFNISLTVWFSTAAGNLGSDDEVVFLISEDGGATWTTLLTWDSSSTVSNTGEGVTIDLTPYTNAYTQFAFYATEGLIDDPEDMEFHVDDFCVATPPDCPAPTFPTASNETNNGADLAWTENGMATMYDLEIVATGVAPTGTPTVMGVANPYTWMGGTPETTYDFYVRADCGMPDGASTWVGPVSFTTLEACPAPTDLTVAAMNNSATLSWTELGSATAWDIELGAGGFTATGTPTATGVMNPYVEMGLTAATDYDYYVRSSCGVDGESDWVGPFAFTTLCDATTPDVCQDFTGYGFGAAPTCWDEASNGDPATGPMDFGAGSWSGEAFGNNGTDAGARINLFTNSYSDWLISEPYDLSGGGIQLDFDIALTVYNSTAAGNLGSDDEVQLLLSEDGGVTWINLMTWDAASTISNLGEAVNVDLSAYTNAFTLLALYGTDGTVDDAEDMEFYVDNFCLTAPADPCPSSLTLTGPNSGDNSDASNQNDNESSGNITSNQTISTGATVDYDSATDIDMINNFEVEAGATFEAFIDGCNNGAGGSNIKETSETNEGNN